MSNQKIILKSGGFKYFLHKRVADLAILSGENRYGSKTFEVVKVRRYSSVRKLPNGKILPVGTEYMPSTSEWGIYGATAFDLNHAECILRRWIRREGSNVVL